MVFIIIFFHDPIFPASNCCEIFHIHYVVHLIQILEFYVFSVVHILLILQKDGLFLGRRARVQFYQINFKQYFIRKIMDIMFEMKNSRPFFVHVIFLSVTAFCQSPDEKDHFNNYYFF